MAKKKTDNTEEVAASNDAVATPVENIQETKQEAEAKAQEESDAKAQQEAEEKAELDVFLYKGVNYAFSKRTPAKLQTEEGLFTQEEILSNHELMQSLIESNCVFITQL